MVKLVGVVALAVGVAFQNTGASVSVEAATVGLEAVILCPLSVSILLTAAVNPPTAVVRSARVIAVVALGSG